MVISAVIILASLSTCFISPEPKAQKATESSRIVRTNSKNAVPESFFEDIRGIAVYVYDNNSNQLARPENHNSLQFDITKAEDIEQVLEAFDYEGRNATDLLIAPNANIFFRHSSGKIVHGKIVGGWKFLMIGNDWSELYPIPDPGVRLLRHKLKTCPRIIKP